MVEDELKIVAKLIEKNFKSGTSEKTGKPWSISKYETNDGITFTSFDDLEEGDTVKITKNDYGFQGAKPRKADGQHDEIMGALRKIYAKLEELQNG